MLFLSDVMTIEKYNLQLYVRSYICFVYLCLGSYWENLGMGRKHGFSGNNKRRNGEQQENSSILDGECGGKFKRTNRNSHKMEWGST